MNSKVGNLAGRRPEFDREINSSQDGFISRLHWQRGKKKTFPDGKVFFKVVVYSTLRSRACSNIVRKIKYELSRVACCVKEAVARN